MRMYVAIAAGLALLAGALVWTIRSQNRAADDVMVLSGNVEVTETDLGFKYSGRVAEMFAEEGQEVHSGERLAALDRAEAEGLAAQARAVLSEAEEKLAELKAGSRPQEIEQARQTVARAEAVLENAKKESERYARLYEGGMVAAQQRDATTSAHLVAASEYRKAREAFDLVREGPKKETIAAAGKRVRQAEASLRVFDERVKDALLLAPADGVVLLKNAEIGEIVSPGTPVYSIGDLGRPWIKVYVKEDRIGLVKLGQKADISIDSYPGKRYEGTVTFIASEAEFTPKNVQTREERVKLVFGVKVSVKNEKNELKPGMPADVAIHLK